MVPLSIIDGHGATGAGVITSPDADLALVVNETPANIIRSARLLAANDRGRVVGLRNAGLRCFDPRRQGSGSVKPLPEIGIGVDVVIHAIKRKRAAMLSGRPFGAVHVSQRAIQVSDGFLRCATRHFVELPLGNHPRCEIPAGGVDRDVHRRGVGVAVSVIHRVGERVAAVKIGVGRVGKCPVAVVDHRPVRRLGEAGDGQRVALGIGVVGQHVARGDGIVLVCGDRVIHCIGRGIGRRRGRDRDVHRRRVGVAVAVIHRVGERVAAVKVGVGRVGKCPVAVVDHRPVRRLGEAGDGQRVALGIRVVDQHIARGDGRVLIGRYRVVDGIGGSVARRNVAGCVGAVRGRDAPNVAVVDGERLPAAHVDGDGRSVVSNLTVGICGYVDRVAARSAVDRVGGPVRGVAEGEGVVEVTSDRALDAAERIDARPAGILRTADGQINGHPRRRTTIVDGVGAGAAIEYVITRPAEERVVAVPAEQAVVAAASGQGVIAAEPVENVVAPKTIGDVCLIGAGENVVAFSGAGDGVAGPCVDPGGGKQNARL